MAYFSAPIDNSGRLFVAEGRRGALILGNIGTAQSVARLLDLVSSDPVQAAARDLVSALPQAGERGAGRVGKRARRRDQLAEGRALIPSQQINDLRRLRPRSRSGWRSRLPRATPRIFAATETHLVQVLMRQIAGWRRLPTSFGSPLSQVRWLLLHRVVIDGDSLQPRRSQLEGEGLQRSPRPDPRRELRSWL